MKIRFLSANGTKYLRQKDVLDILEEFFATEPTDTRTRGDELIRNIKEVK